MGAGKLPKLSGPKLCKILCNKDGFQVVSQKGGHAKLKKKLENGDVLVFPVPMHGKELGHRLLKSIIEESGHTRESFLELLQK